MFSFSCISRDCVLETECSWAQTQRFAASSQPTPVSWGTELARWASCPWKSYRDNLTGAGRAAAERDRIGARHGGRSSPATVWMTASHCPPPKDSGAPVATDNTVTPFKCLWVPCDLRPLSNPEDARENASPKTPLHTYSKTVLNVSLPHCWPLLSCWCSVVLFMILAEPLRCASKPANRKHVAYLTVNGHLFLGV